jgi:hypothetical protein
MAGWEKIEIEREDDRLAIIPLDKEQLRIAHDASGVHDIKPVTNQVFKGETTDPERDFVMAALRSNAFNVISYQAYRPKDSEGTTFYLTDKIIIRFDTEASNEQIERMLVKI